jgi:hypothetical protein
MLKLGSSSPVKLSVESPIQVPLSSIERSRLHRARKRPLETDQDTPTALPVGSAPHIAPEAVAPSSKPASAFSNAVALVAAFALASVAAFFSVTGMIEVFPGVSVAIMVLAASMEAAKLVIAGWLAAHWPVTGWQLRSVLVALVTGLAVINAVGVFGKLVEAHVGVAATASANVSERIDVVDARLTAQSATVADLDHRISQIDAAVEESTRRGRMGNAARAPLRPPREQSRSIEAALAAAVRRWNADLLNQFGSKPIYGDMIDEIDAELQDAATEAEMKRAGGGMAWILKELRARELMRRST